MRADLGWLTQDATIVTGSGSVHPPPIRHQLLNTKLYAHSPAVLAAVKAFVAGFAEATAIPLALKALIRVRVATLNLCPF